MSETIFDGELHALSEKYGYIATRVYEEVDENSIFDALEDKIEKQVHKYCDYLYENNKERVIEYLMESLMPQVMRGITDDNFEIIFRPAHMISSLKFYSTLALKFTRAENDNLKDSDE